MTQTWIFLKKEIFSSLKNYHVYILSGVFLLLGILNVLTAKFTPKLIETLVSKEMAEALPSPTGMDVWLQFHKNVTQMGLIVIVLFFSTILTKEYQKGSLTILLTKGLKRRSVIVAKWAWLVTSFTFYYFLSVGITFIYAYLYFEQVVYGSLGFGLFALWLFGLLICTLIILGSVIGRQSYTVLIFVVGCLIVMFLLSAVTKLSDFIPIQLLQQFMPLLEGSKSAGDLSSAVMMTVILCIAILLSSVWLFERKLI
ncbi:ABC transporter permease [Vagococcus elongatus]|uniref:ABC transporter permease n=1 Tax=Vagococcus elongatus TaxID=180344 RepID=A0A430AX31_9ENTE|nr:ABC transporter permease subunit [Vagococcus elongatus]RSU12631.1 hypothetical protein CBF29_05745 [Vagococcus elongatus]